jgi:hypothetical protein
VTTTAAAAGIHRHTGTYPADARQVGLARAALAGWLGGCPQADEAILIASEFATTPCCTAPPGRAAHLPCALKSARIASGSRWKTAEARGVMGCATTDGRTDSMS